MFILYHHIFNVLFITATNINAIKNICFKKSNNFIQKNVIRYIFFIIYILALITATKNYQKKSNDFTQKTTDHPLLYKYIPRHNHYPTNVNSITIVQKTKTILYFCHCKFLYTT